MSTERIITVNGVECRADVWYEHIVAWAIHTSNNRKDINVERVTPITVEAGLGGTPRFDAQPDLVSNDENFDCTQFTAQFAGGPTGSVRFVQAEPGVRLVGACIEGGEPVGVLVFDLGLEYRGQPLVITDELLAGRATNEVQRRDAKKVSDTRKAQQPTPYRASGSSPGVGVE